MTPKIHIQSVDVGSCRPVPTMAPARRPLAPIPAPTPAPARAPVLHHAATAPQPSTSATRNPDRSSTPTTRHSRSSSNRSKHSRKKTSATTRTRPSLLSSDSTLMVASPAFPSPRRLSIHKYHTFPTAPPKTPNEQPEPEFPDSVSHGGATLAVPGSSSNAALQQRGDGRVIQDDEHEEGTTMTPLPLRQLTLLFLLSLTEQTALNSISPYLPSMVATFSDIPENQVGMYVGLLASAFAVAQLTTSFAWGSLSDTIGRKPVLLLGTTILAASFAVFGLCTKFWQVLLVHVAMGLLNGNAGVVPTILGEITDKSNQSIVFRWLPVVYGLGGITGPAVGGLMTGDDMLDRYPYLGPNVVCAILLGVSVLVLAVFFEETLEKKERMEKSGEGRGCLCCPSAVRRGGRWGLRILCLDSGGSPTSSRRSSRSLEPDEETGLLRRESDDSNSTSLTNGERLPWGRLLNRTTIAILGTYLIFQLVNISFNSLYPIFAGAGEPSGRDLEPEIIGISLSLAGVATIMFQVFLFQFIRARLGNLGTLRWALLGLAGSIAVLPWIGYSGDRGEFGVGGQVWMYLELGVVLVVKNVSAVGGLAGVLLLITNSAPSNDTLGRLNGLAQTLSAAGRSVGPFLSGSLFAAMSPIQPKGEAVAFGVFGAIAVVGWLCSLGISGDHLESEDRKTDE